MIFKYFTCFHFIGLEYHEVVEEYGVHWNFFFTLALVKILSGFLFSVVHPTAALLLSFAVSLSYDLFLVQTGFQSDYLLNPAISRRGSLVDANREGLFSSIGYLSIYLASVYVGQVIYRNVRVRETVGDWLLYCGQSGTQVLILWALTYASHTWGNPCSRRAGNLSYVLWALATNYSILWLHLSLNLAQVLLQHSGLLHGPFIHYHLELKEKRSKEEELQEILDRERARRERIQARDLIDRQTEEALSLIDQKLELIGEKVKEKGASAEDLEAFTKQVERDLGSLRKKCTRQEGESESEDETEGRKRHLVQLPDLTQSPVSLEAICYNGLFVFLLGNLLTGAVNSLIYSIYAPSLIALLTLWLYATIVTTVSLVLYSYKIQLKFW